MRVTEIAKLREENEALAGDLGAALGSVLIYKAEVARLGKLWTRWRDESNVHELDAAKYKGYWERLGEKIIGDEYGCQILDWMRKIESGEADA